MRKVTFIIIVSCIFILSFCSAGSKSSSSTNKNVTVNFPTADDLAAINADNHLSLDQETLTLPEGIEVKKDEEPCDGSDNDQDGLYDEGCYSCNELRADFDDNGIVNNFDCNATILVAYNATVFKGIP